MSQIKRYKVGSYRMVEHGDMVFYDDHQAALKQAKIDAVREFEMQIKRNFYGSVRISDLMKFSEQYIEQLKEQGE